jgi:hypothetical protein
VSVGVVAFHYPKPEYREELVQRVRRAAEVMATVPGLGALTWTVGRKKPPAPW